MMKKIEFRTLSFLVYVAHVDLKYRKKPKYERQIRSSEKENSGLMFPQSEKGASYIWPVFSHFT